MKKTGKSRSKTADTLSTKKKIKTQGENSVTRQAHYSFPIVGIGASAGGLEALVELFQNMPNNTGLGYVVVTHQHPGHISLLPELLGKITTLRVIEATDGMKVEPDHVYVGPPGGYLAILNGTLHRMDAGKSESPHLPIDAFFRSLAEDQREKAICIILSGTGSDGTFGLKAIKSESGMAIVQKITSAKYAGMPSSAVITGLADYVLTPAEMPGQLIIYARSPFLTSRNEVIAPLELPEPMQKIFVLLRARVGHDFSGYKSSTIRRRIERRMNLQQFQNAEEYVKFLQNNPQELDLLFKELLISVTNFFRDPEAFESLAKIVLPKLLESRPDNYTLRVWVPGSATGEEVYSLAILMRETMEFMKKHFEMQIFGTDLDNAALDHARSGLYSDAVAADISPQRLERNFIRDNGSYRIRKDIREMVVFAVQNVIKDPPFTKLDVISCRNLLIYLNADLQKRLLPVFHYALKPGGLLFLGPSEGISGFTNLFEVVDKKWKIYRRKESPIAVFPTMDLSAPVSKLNVEPRVITAARPTRESNIGNVVEKLLLTRFAPASVVVNDRGDVVYIHGRTGAFLEPPSGQPRLNLQAMAKEGLQFELGAALRHAVAGNEDIVREAVRIRSGSDDPTYIDLSVTRIKEPETMRGLFLITFQPRPAPGEREPLKHRPPGESEETGRMEELERELQCTRESLQITIEDLEVSNEELKSTNEELQSTNEELQSTNEELETSKEEMQSLNEELTTVNSEMHLKVEDLSRVNDDMQNLLNSTEIATIFLDKKLNIKRYTEQARHLINLIPSDIGRPLGDLVSKLAYPPLVADCLEVLRTLVFKLTEVQSRDDHWYLMRIMPYRTAENVIDGVVLTFVDINPVKQAEKALLRMSKVFLDGLDPMIIMDLSGRIVDLNEEAARTYGWSRHDLLGQPATILIPEPEQATFNDRLRRCRSREVVRNVQCHKKTKSGQELNELLTFSLLTDERGEPESITLIGKYVSP